MMSCQTSEMENAMLVLPLMVSDGRCLDGPAVMFEITLSLHLLKHNETFWRVASRQHPRRMPSGTAMKEAAMQSLGAERHSVPNFDPPPDARNVQLRDVNLAC